MLRKKSIIPLILIVCLFLTSCAGNKKNQNEDKTTNAVTDEKTEADEDKITESGSDDKTEESNKETEAKTEEETEAQVENMAATLLYQGHASVRIVTGEGKVIYIDPYMGGGYDLPADLILITHDHYDHTKTDLIGEKNPDCTTITWKEALKGGQHESFDLGYVKVETVEAGYNKNHDAGSCVGYILTFSNGVSVYFTGDTSTTPQMSELSDKNIDYAFICCDGIYNMGLEEAAECARMINAKHNIPYHMAPGSEFDMDIAKAFDAPNKIIVQSGEELVLE